MIIITTKGRAVAVVALKSSNVIARVEPEVKEKAEAIMASIGISASTGINMFYRQVILWNGLPFRPAIPVRRPRALEEMTKDEFDSKLAKSMAQAKAGEGMPADEFFDLMEREILKADA